jgi:hypothetical protein
MYRMLGSAPPRFLEGAVESLELAGRTHLVSFTAATRPARDGAGVRRQTDAPPGELLELSGDRRRVDDDGLLPLV